MAESLIKITNIKRNFSLGNETVYVLKGIDLANDCDLKYKLSQNQRLLVELCLMQLCSVNFDGEKKKLTS